MALLTLMSGSTASDVSALWGWVSLASLAGGAAMAVVFWQALRGNGKPLILFSVLGAAFLATSQPYVIAPLAFLIVCTIVGIRHQVEDEESPKGGMSK